MSARTADARNRALRTVLQGFAFTVAAAIVVSILSAVTSATSWSEFGGALVAFSFFQSVAVAGLSWLMRAVLDKSAIPTPLPPADEGGYVEHPRILLVPLAISTLLWVLLIAGAWAAARFLA